MLTVGQLSGLAAQNDAASYVNTLIGTQRSALGYGGTMPFVTTPFGMTSWTPQTRQNKISVTSYNYDDTTISGFIGTHQPAIWMGDYGYVTVIPQVGELRTTPESRKLPYSHGTEKARPDYYSVSLNAAADGTIQAEMTATERCSILRFTFPKTAEARVIVEASRPGIAGMASVNLLGWKKYFASVLRGFTYRSFLMHAELHRLSNGSSRFRDAERTCRRPAHTRSSCASRGFPKERTCSEGESTTRTAFRARRRR